MRFVAQADLKILDPVWTTAYITRNHAYLVYDTLFGTDEKLQVRPQMVDKHAVSRDGMKYTFTLRDGLKWHDGQPVVAEDCAESLKRWMKKDRFGRLLAAHTAKVAPVDRKTFTLELGERFGPVLEALGKPSSNVPFMMPARIAAHLRRRADQGDRRLGAVPLRRRTSGSRATRSSTCKHADYVPRNEAPSGSTGGKKVHLDKVVWRYIPDPATAAGRAGGRRGRLVGDPADRLRPEDRAERHRWRRSCPIPLGTQGWLRPEPPASAVQQQEGPAGAGRHDEPETCICRPAIGQAEVLPHLPLGLRLQRPLREQGRRRGAGQAESASGRASS